MPYRSIPGEPGEPLAWTRRMNVMAELVERLNEAGIECGGGGSTADDGAMHVTLGWKAARKLLRLLRERGIGDDPED